MTASKQAAGCFAGRAVPHGPYRPVSMLIEEQVDRTPDRPALSYAGRTLTYREVDELANGLAHRLAARNVRRGDVVPVALPNSLELPLAYLALMKLGAAFVPIDPQWPAARLRAVLDVIAPRLVLTTPQAPQSLARDSVHTHVVRIDEVQPSAVRPTIMPGPDEFAYGVFTSGTTGTPKCAINVHCGLTNRFRFMTRYFAATGDEVVLQNSKHTYDSAIWQLFWSMTTGGHTVVPRQGEFLDLEQIIDLIAAYRVTVTDFVPGVLSMLVSLAESDPTARRRISSLRHIVVGGEEINPAAVHRLRHMLGHLRVTNGYGPSEASIGMVFHLVSEADGDAIPLGRPIDNCYAVVVDEQFRALPPETTGEILIGGACLGAGYYGEPARTAAAFVPNPFSQIPGTRLYRTGDFGYFDEHGRLFFAGRRDRQVKVGGVRIELGEIEVAAQRCPGVRHAKALTIGQGSTKSLIVVAAAHDGVSAESLRRYLATTLPRTSLPRHCFVVTQLPLTPVGKVDLRALEQYVRAALTRGETPTGKAAGDAASAGGAGAFAARASAANSGANRGDPSLGGLAGDARLAGLLDGDLVSLVTEVFGAALGTPTVTPNTEFVVHGGDSLQALATVVRLRSLLNVDVGVPDLLTHPTPASLATLLRERLKAKATRPVADHDAATSTAQPSEDEAALMAADALLPADLVIRPARFTPSVRTVLVTGATGFVGSRVVHQLLASTDLHVVCLTRASDYAAACGRVIAALREQGLWRPRFAARLAAYPGDLGQSNLGLSPHDWARLAAQVDVILHIGALVNFLFDYRAHRPANVLGTTEVLRLAMAGTPKPLHHVSTLGVLDREAARHTEPLGEAYDVAQAVAPTSGYSRSKWVAERRLVQARQAGAAVTVWRLGEVMPATDNGFPNRRALTHLLLTAAQWLGVCPDAPIYIDYTTVDSVAVRLVDGLFDPDVLGRTLHVFHPRSVRLTDILGSLPRVGEAEFLARLRTAAAQPSPPELATLLEVLTRAANAPHLAELLVDNPRLFRRDECARFDARCGRGDEPPDQAMAAYRRWLVARHESLLVRRS